MLLTSSMPLIAVVMEALPSSAVSIVGRRALIVSWESMKISLCTSMRPSK
jgi:hypothetical protein